MKRYSNIIQEIMEFNFTIWHISSQKNIVTNFISRTTLFKILEDDPVKDVIESHQYGSICSLWSLFLVYRDISQYQPKEEYIKGIYKQVVEQGGEMGNYKVINSVLYKRIKAKRNP